MSGVWMNGTPSLEATARHAVDDGPAQHDGTRLTVGGPVPQAIYGNDALDAVTNPSVLLLISSLEPHIRS